MNSVNDFDLTRLHRDLNHRWLNPWWAKCEIVLGLLGVAVAFVAGIEIGFQRATHPENAAHPTMWLGPIVIFVLGAYLALAGHRSHLYQSNNRLAAYLAGLIRTHSPGPRP
jgi:hypothetical protein